VPELLFGEPLFPPPLFPFPPPPFPPPNPVENGGGVVVWATVVWVVSEGVVETEEKRDEGDGLVDFVESDISSRHWQGDVGGA